MRLPWINKKNQRSKEMKGNYSLRARLLIVSGVVISVFFTVLAIIVSYTFDLYLQDSAQERIKLQIYSLISLIEFDEKQHIHLPSVLREQRFNQLDSGLYALVTDDKANILWRSASAKKLVIKNLTAVPRGKWSYERIDSNAGESLLLMKYGVGMQDPSNSRRMSDYNVMILEHLRPLREETQSYRLAIFAVLILLLSVMLALEALILHWGLEPLRKLSKELRQLQSGNANQLDEHYPKELSLLVSNLNLLLANEREQRQRYRNTMADLAHSLKTPLAVLKVLPDHADHQSRQDLLMTIHEQVDRMDKLVQHQLSRAVQSSIIIRQNWIKLAPYAHSTLQALQKVYLQKAVAVEHVIEDDLFFCGDENDLLDILGNLLDNAFKQCHQKVVFKAFERKKNTMRQLVIEIEDDGSGVPLANRQDILQRGVRLDTRAAGHGVGLATVMTIIEGYRGTLEIDDSILGGALFRVVLPLR